MLDKNINAKRHPDWEDKGDDTPMDKLIEREYRHILDQDIAAVSEALTDAIYGSQQNLADALYSGDKLEAGSIILTDAKAILMEKAEMIVRGYT